MNEPIKMELWRGEGTPSGMPQRALAPSTAKLKNKVNPINKRKSCITRSSIVKCSKFPRNNPTHHNRIELAWDQETE